MRHGAFRLGPPARSPPKSQTARTKFRRKSAWARPRGSSRRSYGIGPGLAGAYAQCLHDGRNENFAIADLPGLRRRTDGFDDLIGILIGHHDFDADFWQEIHRVFGPAIKLGVPFLPAIALYLGDGHAEDPDSGQGVADFLELKWLDDSGNEFHGTARSPAQLERTISALGLGFKSFIADFPWGRSKVPACCPSPAKDRLKRASLA